MDGIKKGSVVHVGNQVMKPSREMGAEVGWDTSGIGG